MKEIGAFEANTRLGQLLDLVERGEEVIITRHGKAVAKLVPTQAGHDRQKVAGSRTNCWRPVAALHWVV